ncbi:hypothetical protein G6O69_10035 [Pseudenhygromyxa sp. WMMC2535]|uniref:hypothetical protein n=1 Tax=Pseudenhygromyxa sp. WMMC2535 TaxID=2712867 RepID=UPI001595E743|nr:hypothetical protein [Pseudenhygromyxa sp. WMMC2535]NVB38171.1 hypothetical protein [Pseudenhygromyxa sp. WMMC2535]
MCARLVPALLNASLLFACAGLPACAGEELAEHVDIPRPISRSPIAEPVAEAPAVEAPFAAADDAHGQVEPTPPPAEQPPLPFADREQVRVDELLEALRDELDAVAASPAVRADYEAFLEDFELEDDDEGALYRDYVRIKVAFEATRDGGWWGLAWRITNEQPNSEKIWAQWQRLDRASLTEGVSAPTAPTVPTITAIAECDELSALFAFVARRLGLGPRSEVGLFWPTGNHVVAVWTLDRKTEHATRIVVPTTQIMLSSDASLGDRGFDPWRQRKIFDYRREDAAPGLEIPGALARAFVAQVRAHAGEDQATLQAERAARELRQLELLEG